jgi:hypothetical protein
MRELLEATTALSMALHKELGIFEHPVAEWPGSIEAYLPNAVINIRPSASRYRALLHGHEAGTFQDAWEAFVNFCHRKIPYRDYKTAKWYRDMKPEEDPSEILKFHIKTLHSFTGTPL